MRNGRRSVGRIAGILLTGVDLRGDSATAVCILRLHAVHGELLAHVRVRAGPSIIKTGDWSWWARASGLVIEDGLDGLRGLHPPTLAGSVVLGGWRELDVVEKPVGSALAQMPARAFLLLFRPFG
jgi:hypothetical protein